MSGGGGGGGIPVSPPRIYIPEGGGGAEIHIITLRQSVGKECPISKL